MSYLGFLLLFLVPPIAVLLLLIRRQKRQVQTQPPPLPRRSPWWVLLALVLIALLYTTPWDNYLVATRVWWYNPALVTGIVFGWVPLEEYLFFILQPILVGLWLLWLAPRFALAPATSGAARGNSARAISLTLVGTLWLISLVLLIADRQPTRYLALELVWALPPILLQLAFGADLLLCQWRLLLLTIVPATLYLAAADTLALAAGTWTIDPGQSTGLLLGGRLPIEELLFFLLTTILVSFGLTLGIATDRGEVKARWQRWRARSRAGSLSSHTNKLGPAQ
jgi:lycopene cyclase domain-containing protein